MASTHFPDILTWIQNFPRLPQWPQTSILIALCPSLPSSPPLNFTAEKNSDDESLSFAIVVEFRVRVYLWTSKRYKMDPNSANPFNEDTIFSLMMNFIEPILRYGMSYRTLQTVKIPNPTSQNAEFKDIFNLVVLTLTFLVCIYEAPEKVRPNYVNAIIDRLVTARESRSMESLMRLLGSNLEQGWMRSVNLALTNWFVAVDEPITRSLPFSYAVSTFGMWKVHLHCPVIAMDVESSSRLLEDSRLKFSLNFHQLQGVVQFSYKVVVREKWVDVITRIDNVRYDITRLLNETLMAKKGAGETEKHFPSRISLQLTPTLQTNITSVSVSKSSHNPETGIGVGTSIGGTFDPQSAHLGISVTASKTTTVSVRPWKFEQLVSGYTANLNWVLYDQVGKREVSSSRRSILSLIGASCCFKDRYEGAYRPFTGQGGVIFAGDEYGESVCWRVDKRAIGKSMEWEIRGWVWVTYRPNRYKTFYSETRRLEFRETLHLTIA